MTDGLKPCPFCGKDDTIETAFGGDSDQCMSCWNCRSFGPPSEKTSRERWNHRPVEDVLRARIAELEAQLAAIPWDDLSFVLSRGLDEFFLAAKCSGEPLSNVLEWLDANAPKETA